MIKEEFTAKISELCTAPDAISMEAWIEFAEDVARYHRGYLDDCGGAHDSFTEDMAQRLTLEANLDDLHNAFSCVHQKYGSEITQLIFLQGGKCECMYPNSFMRAAEYLQNGGSIDKVGQMSVDELFENGNMFWSCSIQDCEDMSTEGLSRMAKSAADVAVENGLRDRVTDDYILKLDDLTESLDYELDTDEKAVFQTAALGAIRSHPKIKGIEISGDRVFLSFNEPFLSAAYNLPSENFKKLNDLAPAFLKGEEHYTAFVSPRDPTRLIEFNRANPQDAIVTMTQTVQSGGHHPITDVSMELHLNAASGTVNAMQIWREGWPESKCVHTGDLPDKTLESELNQFLSGWLDDIKQTGFERMEPQDDGICQEMTDMTF